MKKFIVFIITAIILAVATSFTAKAQYINGNPKQDGQEVSAEKPNLLLMPEYKAAKEKERDGRTQFYAGLGIELIGCGILAIPVADSDIRPAVIGGGVLLGLIGSITAIAGACQWYNGAVELRDLRLEYSLANGGVIVAF